MTFVFSLSNGAIPCLPQVHCPNIAFSLKRANVTPTTFLGCLSNCNRNKLYPFLSLAQLRLHFLLNNLQIVFLTKVSHLVLFGLLKILKVFFCFSKILLFSSIMRGMTILINVSFFVLVLFIFFRSFGNLDK